MIVKKRDPLDLHSDIDVDFRVLVQDVSVNGVRKPIVVSSDDRVVHGHQRLAAAIEANLTEVPTTRLARKSETCPPHT